MSHNFAHELKRYGPQGLTADPVPLATANAYCRRLAETHYENFTVASCLLPRELRQHFYNVYAYCRWADDLADETGSAAESLELLDWWEQQLRNIGRGEAHHPVFVALAETVRQFEIPLDPLADLLVAFRQDQRVRRYETHEEVLDYCRHSANPVGRLVLYLGRCHRAETAALSDRICTGLQLANFCQDVAGDWDRGRVYLPQQSCRAHGYDEAMFARREFNDAFRGLLAEECKRAEEYLHRGAPLTRLVPRALRLDVALFIRGGLAVLDAIRRIDYNVWRRRPTVSKLRKAALLLRCLVRRR